MTAKTEKDKNKVFQEKLQMILCQLLREDDNKYCVDCDTQGPRWASWNLGIFLCIRCAGIHRNLGVHISRVKSVNLDSWTPEQVAMMKEMGNSRARAVYEANLPDNYRRPLTDSALEIFIRQKYEEKKYMAREFVPPKLDAVIRSLQLDDSNDTSARSSASNSSKARPRPVSTVVESQSRPRQHAAAEVPKPAAAAAALGGGMPHIQTDPQIHPPKTDLLGDMDLLAPPVVNKSSSEGDLLGISFAASVNVTDPYQHQHQQLEPQQQQLMQPEVDLFGEGSASEQKRQTNKENILKLYSSGPTPSAMAPMGGQMGYMGPMGMMQQQPVYGMRPMNGMAAAYVPPPGTMMGGGWGGAMPAGVQPNPMMMMRPAASVPQPASAASYNFIPGTFGQPHYNQQQVMPNPYASYPAAVGAPPRFPVNQQMMANGNQGSASNSSGQTLSTHLWQ